jgi:hypothetical protein
MEVHDNTFGHLQMHWMSVQVTISVHTHALSLTSSIISIYHLMLAMITSVRLVCHQVNSLTMMSSMLMIPCGMVKVVVQLAHAAHSTIHHGFVNNYLSQLMLIWKSDCAQLIVHKLKILQ